MGGGTLWLSYCCFCLTRFRENRRLCAKSLFRVNPVQQLLLNAVLFYHVRVLFFPWILM